MTRRALYFLLAALAFLLAALSTGSQIYYLLLIAMVCVFLLSLIAVSTSVLTLRVGLKGVRKTVERGASVPLCATVRHDTILPVKTIALRLSVPDETGELGTIELDAPPFISRSYELQLPCPHRGIYPIGVTDISVTDVFGLLNFKKKIDRCRFQVEVAPRARKLPAMPLGTGDIESNRMPRMTEDNASPADVRLWREGDALKKVHWKLSMRKRELMVRTYEESAKPDTLILLDLSPLGLLRAHALTIEDAVCETGAAIARAQLEEGYPVRMPLAAKQPTEVSGDNTAALPAFVSALTTVQFDSPYPFEKVILLEMRRMQRLGGAVLVTPRLNPRIADLAIQLRQGGMSVCVVWVTDNRREEALQLLSRLQDAGIRALRVDPWGDGLTEAQMMGQVSYE